MAEIHAMNAQFVSTKKNAALNPVDEASTTDTAVAEELSQVVKTPSTLFLKT